MQSKIVTLSCLLLAITLLASTISASETELFIVNLSKFDIQNTVVTVDTDADWDNGSGPHHNFQAVQIPSGQAVRAIEYVNDYAPNCPFTMFLEFGDGTKDEFRINQKFAIGQSPPDFLHLLGDRTFLFEAVDKNVLMITIKDKAV